MTGKNYQMVIFISFHPPTFAAVFNKLNLSSTYKCNFLGADNKQ